MFRLQKNDQRLAKDHFGNQSDGRLKDRNPRRREYANIEPLTQPPFRVKDQPFPNKCHLLTFGLYKNNQILSTATTAPLTPKIVTSVTNNNI